MEALFTSDNIWKLLLAGMVGVAVVFSLLRSARAGMLVIGVMLFLSGMGLTKEQGQNTDFRTWLFPLQANRPYLYAACAALLTMGVLIHAGRLNMRNVPGLGWLFVLLGIYMGTVTIFHDGVGAGVSAIFFAIFTIVPMLLVVPSILKEWDDWVGVLRAIAVSGAVWTIACTVQFLVNQNVLLTGAGRRFVGLSGNPQHAANFSAVIAMVATWLVLNDAKKRWKPLWIFVAASHVVFVLWTGSRTGLLCGLIGMTAIFYARIGRAVFFAPVIAGAIYGLVTLATAMGVQFGFERLTSTQDTRTEKWWTLWENGLANPIIGMGLQEAGGSENGFLYGFASYGIGVPLLLLLYMFISIFICLRLLRTRFSVAPMGKRLVDLCIGFFAIYWVGNLLEGYAIARMSPQLIFIIIFACLSAALLNKARDEQAEAAELAEHLAENPPPLPEGHEGHPPLDDLSDGQDYSWYGRREATE